MDHAGTDSLSVVPLGCLHSSGSVCACMYVHTLARHIVCVHPSVCPLSLWFFGCYRQRHLPSLIGQLHGNAGLLDRFSYRGHIWHGVNLIP